MARVGLQRYRINYHHQEVVYCICSLWYLSCIYVD